MTNEALQVNSQHPAAGTPAAPTPTHLLVMSSEDVIARTQHIQKIRLAVMKDGVHFGIPFGGSSKASLWKPGAEILFVTFGLAPRFIVQEFETADEYRVVYTCEVYTIGTNTYVAAGTGEASSNELKYKWRAAVCDEEFQATPENKRRVHYKKSRNGFEQIKQIRTELADVRNTIRKMSKKRSYVDAALTATGASDMFEQDIEDLLDNGVDVEASPQQTTRPANGRPVHYLVRVEEKSGNKNGGGKWTKYGLVTKTGETFWTFHESLAELADRLIADGQPCTIDFKKTKFGNDIDDKDGVKPVTLPKEAQEPAPSPAASSAATIGIEAPAPMNNGQIMMTFKPLGIWPSHLESKIGKPKEEWTDADRQTLQRIANAILGGEPASEYFTEL